MKKFILAAFIAFVALGAAVFTSCDKGVDPPLLYSITVSADAGGTAQANKTKAEAGETVGLSAIASEGFVFSRWTVQSGSVSLSPNSTAASASFTMPEGNVSLRAEFAELGDGEEPIEISDEEQLQQTAFADDETTGEISFTAKAAWEIDVNSLNSTRAPSVQWVRLYLDGVETYSGPAGEFTLEVVVDGNYTGETRDAVITIASGGGEIEISVTQQAEKEDGTLPIAVTGITIAPEDEISLRPGESTRLSATVAPENAENLSVVWSVAPASSATINESGLLTIA